MPTSVLVYFYKTPLGWVGQTAYEADAYRKDVTQQNCYKTTWESAASSVACAKLCLNEANSVEWVAFGAARRDRTMQHQTIMGVSS